MPRADWAGVGVGVGVVADSDAACGVNQRVEAMFERIATLRSRAEELVVRAENASARSRRTIATAGTGCRHAEQSRAMKASLVALEQELQGLRTAMATRGVIEQAKGMLMMHRHCDADEAFRLLVQLSQQSHTKLVEVAQQLVATWGPGGEHADP